MEENNQINSNQDIQQTEVNEEIEQNSYTDILTTFIANPSEGTWKILQPPKRHLWIISMIIVLVIGALSNFLRLNDVDLFQQEKAMAIDRMKKIYSNLVKEGKMSQEDADKSITEEEEATNPSNTGYLLKRFGGGALFTIVIFFLLSLFLVIVIAIMRTNYTYVNLLNILSLCFIIVTVGNLFESIIGILVSNFQFNLSLGYLLGQDSLGNFLYYFLSSINLFIIIFWVYLSIGMARLSGKSAGLFMGILIPVYFLLMLAFSYVGSMFS